MSDKKLPFKLKFHFGKVSAILIAVFAVLLTADLVLKYCYEFYDWNFQVIPRLIYVENDPSNHNNGAAFSFLSNTEWGRIFFIVLTFIMLIVMIFAFTLLPERFVCLKTAIAMIAAGALGNLVDRLAFGYVRDFVWVNIFGKWACCNFADFWIVFGAILAVLDMLFLNEWAVLPLTKTARAAAEKRAEAEKQKLAEPQAHAETAENEDLEKAAPEDAPQEISADSDRVDGDGQEE